MTPTKFWGFIILDIPFLAGFLYLLFVVEPGALVASLVGSFLILVILASGKAVADQIRRIRSSNQLDIALALYALSTLAVQIILMYAILYRWFGIFDGNSIVKEPLDFLYFSIVTWTTLGYGDIRPSLDSRMIA